MPFAILLLGAGRARLVLTAVGMLSCIYPIVSCHSRILWKEVVKIGLFMSIGILAAQIFLKALYSPEALLAYSLLVIMVAVRNFIQIEPLKLPASADYLILLAAGLVHGAFLSGGSLLVIYAMRHFCGKDEQRATLSVIWLLLNGGMLGMFIAQKQYNLENLYLIGIALLPAAMGIFAGDVLQKRFDERKFRIFTNCMLILSGGVLLFNCLKDYLYFF